MQSSDISPTVVPEPDKTRAVFVHALEDCPEVKLPECVWIPPTLKVHLLTYLRIVEADLY
jgi:GINS complex subunit 4